MKKLLLLITILGCFQSTKAQEKLLQAGPMLGYSEMREVLIWVQTTRPADVIISYWEIDSTGKSISDTMFTDIASTYAPDVFTAKLIADKVEPSKRYGYDVFINRVFQDFGYPTSFKTQPLWQWRHDPPPFKMALGSCAYVNEEKYDRPGRPYGGEYGIFDVIANQKPDMMMWLGDNMYLREADWFTRTGIMHRFTHTRSLPEMQKLLRTTHNYAIWDDHDFGPNNSNRSFIHKETTLEAFKLFWGNPTFGVNGKKGINTQFQFHDIDFFLLDNRYYRSPEYRKSGKKTMLGEDQIEWLIDALSSSYAPFKMVCLGSQFLNTVDGWETYATFPEERNYLIERLKEENIKGVIFLTGDRHHSELSKYTSRSGWSCYDLTVSPLTAGASTFGKKENNLLRVDGTLVSQRNFGTIDFYGKRKERELKITVFDNKGTELWNKVIKASEWK